MVQHLRDAARRRHDDAMTRSERALLEMATAAEPITFAAVARRAGISTDFLYRQPQIRKRIQQLRTALPVADPPAIADESTSSSAIRALAARLKETRRQHFAQLAKIQTALEVAQGENLTLRREIARMRPTDRV